MNLLPTENTFIKGAFSLFLEIFPTTLAFGYEEVGDVDVVVELSNLVSKVTLKYSFTMVERIEDLQVDAESSFSGLLSLENGLVVAAEGESLKFVVFVGAGSHVDYVIYYGDGNSDAKPSPVLLAINSVVIFTHDYEDYGIYDINITATNLVHSTNALYPSTIKVLEIVESVIVSVKKIDFDEELYGSSIFDELSEIFSLLFASPASLK